MALEVEVISTETIKPSSPTPPHLKALKLCLLDQLMPLISIPLILFYSANQDQDQDKLLHRLKKSLSDVLIHFYPLAGRISDNLTIDCNDEGVNFFQARVTGKVLEQIVSNPISDELIQLLPKDNLLGEGPKLLLSIQANIFDCSGVAVSVCMSHKAGDASSLSLFLTTWAAVARGEHSGIISPVFDMTSFFPPKDIPMHASRLTHRTEKLVTKRFLFSASNIAALRAKCSDQVENPTRVEVISALIWSCAINIANPASAALHTMDLRKRMDPPLSNAYFGNLVTSAMAATTPESSLQLPCLVAQLRESIRKIDGEYVKKLQDGDGIYEFLAVFMKANELYMKGETELYSFTSWCKLPFYDADFGWGKPIWASPADFPAKNIIGLVDTKSGDGVEAWIALYEAEMARFEREPQLIAFTTTDHMV